MFIIDNELFIRLGIFLGIFCILALLEKAAPRRTLSNRRGMRWPGNLFITLLNSVAVRIIFPTAAVGVALMAEWSGWGLFNILRMPALPSGAASLVLLDLTIYLQHFFFHKVNPLWRLHRMHHTDTDVDVTTGSRFHPVEIVLSMEIKIGVVILLGTPAWSVLVFEVLLNATSMFNHSNIHIRPDIDRMLRRLVVTPDMHRVHHSVVISETNSNFGFNFPWWDRIFRTYKNQPQKGHLEMVIGLANYRDRKYLTLPWMLAIPFLRKER